jgi:hypothetical protein
MSSSSLKIVYCDDRLTAEDNLKMDLNKRDRREWTGLLWPLIGKNDWLLGQENEQSGYMK